MYNATILRNKEANMYTSFSNLENIVGEYGNDSAKMRCGEEARTR